MAYPLEELDPMSSDSDKEKALLATISQLISEGVPEQEAQTKAMQMLSDMASMPQWPSAPSVNYGDTMQNPNSLIMRGRGTEPVRNAASFRTQREQHLNNFKHGFNSDGRTSNK